MERKFLNEYIRFGMEGSQDWEKALLNVLRHYEMNIPYYTNKLEKLILGLNNICYSNKTVYKNQTFVDYAELLSYVYPEFVWCVYCVESNTCEGTMTCLLLSVPSWISNTSKVLSTYLIECAMGKSEDWNKIKELNVDDKENIIKVINDIGDSGKAVYNGDCYKDIKIFLNNIFKNKNIIWDIKTIKYNNAEYTKTILVAVY